jgi:hypothetical protein
MSLRNVFFVLGFAFVLLSLSLTPHDPRYASPGPNVGFAASAGLCMVAAAITHLADKIGKEK